MTEEDKKKKLLEAKDFIPLDEAIAKTVFYREFAELKKKLGESQNKLEEQQNKLDNQRKRLESQEQLSWQIIIGVCVAFVLTVGVVAVEVILFHSGSDKDLLKVQNQCFQEIKSVQNQNYEIRLDFNERIRYIEQKINDLEVIQK